LEQGISKLSLDKGNKLKEGHGGLPKESFFVCVWGEKKKGGGNVRKELVFMCGKVFMGKVCGRIKHGRKLCVASAYNKASGFFCSISCSSQNPPLDLSQI